MFRGYRFKQFYHLVLFSIAILLLCSSLQADIAMEGTAEKIVKAAKQQIGKTTHYDPQYHCIKYPLGDVTIEKGVCTDVIIRSLRQLGVDLQVLVHEDMKKNWKAYPKKWGLKNPDKNIDHRRVPNLMTYFDRQKFKVLAEDFNPGDFVVWDLGGGVLHIGILSDHQAPSTNRLLVIHNICCGVKEEDILLAYKIVGHYRYNAISQKL